MLGCYINCQLCKNCAKFKIAIQENLKMIKFQLVRLNARFITKVFLQFLSQKMPLFGRVCDILGQY